MAILWTRRNTKTQNTKHGVQKMLAIQCPTETQILTLMVAWLTGSCSSPRLPCLLKECGATYH